MVQKDFAVEVAKLLPYILRSISQRQHNFFLKANLTLSQIVILEFLADHGSCKMNELAKVLNFTMSAGTATVDKMVRTKLVKRERSTKDRRVVRVMLLSKGVEMVGKIMELRRDSMNEMFASLTGEDKVEYLRILRKVADNLRKET